MLPWIVQQLEVEAAIVTTDADSEYRQTAARKEPINSHLVSSISRPYSLNLNESFGE